MTAPLRQRHRVRCAIVAVASNSLHPTFPLTGMARHAFFYFGITCIFQPPAKAVQTVLLPKASCRLNHSAVQIIQCLFCLPQSCPGKPERLKGYPSLLRISARIGRHLNALKRLRTGDKTTMRKQSEKEKRGWGWEGTEGEGTSEQLRDKKGF